MAKSTLMRRVIAHTTGQKTSGQNTLALFVETVDHWMGESNDWSPLAALVGRSEPAQARALASLVRVTTFGWTLKDDSEQTPGKRFVKIKDKNQGFDETMLGKIRALVKDKKSIQSEDVKALYKKASEDITPTEKVFKKIDNAAKGAVKIGAVSRMVALARFEAAWIAAEKEAVKKSDDTSNKTEAEETVAAMKKAA